MASKSRKPRNGMWREQIKQTRITKAKRIAEIKLGYAQKAAGAYSTVAQAAQDNVARLEAEIASLPDDDA